MTIRDPHTGVISEDVFHSIDRVVTILDVEPNRLIFHWLVAALAITFYPHLRPNAKL